LIAASIVAAVNTPDQEERMLAEYPQLKTACLTLSEIMADKLRETLARYRISTPEERYRELSERRPALLQRVPQYLIASCLGVQPESLSRIRSRLSRLGPKRDRSGRT
jgi:CRP-like cAMP-binding protein